MMWYDVLLPLTMQVSVTRHLLGGTPKVVQYYNHPGCSGSNCLSTCGSVDNLFWTLGFFMWCGFFMNKLLGLSVGRRGPKRLEHGRCALRKCRSAGIIEHRSARLEDRCRLLSKKEMSGRPLAEVPFRLCFTMVGGCSNESVKGN